MVIEELTNEKNGSCSAIAKLFRDDQRPVEWRISDKPMDYAATVEEMRDRARAVADGKAGELIWLLEHPALYTAGTSAKSDDLLDPERFPVFDAGRGGQYTYHGPGQRIAYVMLDLTARGRDVRCFVQGLENWVIDTLAAFNIKGERRDGRVGVWVQRPDRGFGAEDKIAAIGIRVSRWASFHGISINVSPDLTHYDGIVACGIRDHGVTSLEDLGQITSMAEVDMAMKAAFERQFGPVTLTASS